MGVDFFRPIAEGLIREVAPRPGDRALDIGCGRGAVLVPLARAVAPGGTSTGIDLSPRMVELARVAIDDAAVTATAAVDDAMAPGFEPASFEVVTSSLVLFFLPDPAVALAAWRELLAPGGRIGVTTFGPYTEQWRTAVDEVLQRCRVVGAGVFWFKVRAGTGPATHRLTTKSCYQTHTTANYLS